MNEPTTEAKLEVGRHVDQLPSKEELYEMLKGAPYPLNHFQWTCKVGVVDTIGVKKVEI